TICIIGASGKKGSLGYELTSCVKNYGYLGELFLVNPKTEEILGIKCSKSINNIKTEIDLAIVMVPKQFAEETISNLIQKQVKAIILITAGFKETGEEGKKAEEKIITTIHESESRLVGPNCMGIINTLPDIKLNATFVAEKPETGKLAFLSQSGAIGAAVLNSLRETDIRFAHFISVGNKADINENDLIDFWENDSNIKVITLYLESFVDGENFIQKFFDGSVKKPVIILKAGRTKGGIKAASSHTGALGSSDKVVASVLKQFNIIRADDLNELFNTAKGFEYFPEPKGKRVAVVTNAGGPAILAVDAIEKNFLSLAELSPETKTKLREIVHPEGSVNNPVDLLPGGTAEAYKKVNELLLKDPNVDSVVSVFVEPIMVNAFEVIEKINEIEAAKPLLQVVMPLPEFWNQYRLNSKKKIPLFRNPEDPAKVISNVFHFYNKRKEISRLKKSGNENLSKQNKNGFLNQDEVTTLMNSYKIPVAETRIVSRFELNNQDFQYPLVLKAVGKEIIHKSELNAVQINIKNLDELIVKADEMIKNLHVQTFLVQPYLKIRFEILVGAFRDSSFGPMIMFGSGGKYVEVFDDTSTRSAYLSDEDIDEMINETKIGKILKGVRGEKPADISAIKEVIKSVAQMMLNEESITECDLNPLIVTAENKIFAVDVRVKV
ncbi:MAG TPA: acetate--CoA ligase family protein, partial [Ignavibacteriaceae bacterium]|nr:acetate--CoA ligase family protein [Ignavibacteriaceae bacterium]